MTEIFTVEEVNLMCIFAGPSGANTTSRSALLTDLIEAVADFEDELFEIAAPLIERLSQMSDAEFAALELYPEYDDYEEMED
ncbi:hypothetical protein FACS1894208_08300 [Clostridia bacterium]|nr:hypothetical protein FACS1894208_08300 [Clostridia bacterium]